MIQSKKKFIFKKEQVLTYVKSLGKGVYCETHLFHDEITDKYFAIKKYAPKMTGQSKEEFDRFIEEAKILFSLSHDNIVRIHDYYLYPDDRTGYLQMEYIKGTTIDKFVCSAVRDWNDIFIETIYAFQYLEEQRVLHRDVRDCNIMVDESGKVKVIDFGHGAVLNPKQDATTDIFPLWPFENLPKEITEHNEYTHQTDMYFLGMLFKSLPLDDNISFPFLYHPIIDIMAENNPLDRHKSFGEILAAISNPFTAKEWQTYRRFADAVSGTIDYFKSNINCYDFHDTDKIVIKLADLLRVNMFDEYVCSSALIDCLVRSPYAVIEGVKVKRDIVEDFYNALTNMSEDRQATLIDNIKEQFYGMPIVRMDSLPF